tara:strand:+ start:1188 stop:2300 length:1113 start_codon:yes stop_codon:yes gene_type:complete
MRRFEIDSIRSIALLLLIFYHIIISFIPETIAIGFVVNSKSDNFTDYLLLFSQSLNIWRMPILFLISGMALSFSSVKRSNKELIYERLKRIMLPLTFCSFFIVPLGYLVSANYYNSDFSYWPLPAYLWFLNSIFYYSLLIIPVIYFKKRNANIFNIVEKLLINKFMILFLFSLPLILIAGIFNPKDYSNFVNFPVLPFIPLGDFNAHGFLVGLVCFMIGYLFASTGDVFWNLVKNLKFITLILAAILFLQRLIFYQFPVWEGEPVAYSLKISNMLTAFESVCWMVSFTGLASSFLSKKNLILTYITAAVFPIYIFHMPVQFLVSSLVYPISYAPILKFITVFSLTLLICLMLYEIVKRLKGFRIVFGLKP